MGTRASVSVLVTMSWCHVVVVVTCCLVLEVTSHGRLAHPPARATAWRYGFNTPANYNDNELFCGGFTHQWQKNGGKCGICGCADISIRGQGWTTSKKPLTTTARPATTTARATTTTAAPTAKSTPTVSPTSRPTSCWAVNEFEGVVAMDKWCQDNCLSGYCPASMCECASDKMPSTASPVKTTAKAPASTSRPSMCWAINEWEGQASVDAWCLHSCLTGICPENMCECI